MKKLVFALPLVLAACSSDNNSISCEQNDYMCDSLSAVVAANNDSIQKYLGNMPKMCGLLLPESSLVKKGEEFNAKIGVVSALRFGDFTATINDETVTASDHVVVYRVKADKEGPVTYNGVLKFVNPGGTTTEYQFTGSYYVSASAPSVTVEENPKMEDYVPQSWQTGTNDFDGHKHDYKTWFTSTLNFDVAAEHDSTSLARIIVTQDSIISAITNMQKVSFKFDQLLVAISPVSAIVKPGEEYVAFIYPVGLNSVLKVDVKQDDTGEEYQSQKKISHKAAETGFQHYSNVFWFETQDGKRDSVIVNANYFVE